MLKAMKLMVTIVMVTIVALTSVALPTYAQRPAKVEVSARIGYYNGILTRGASQRLAVLPGQPYRLVWANTRTAQAEVSSRLENSSGDRTPPRSVILGSVGTATSTATLTINTDANNILILSNNSQEESLVSYEVSITTVPAPPPECTDEECTAPPPPECTDEECTAPEA